MNAWRLALLLIACESPSGSGYAPLDTEQDVGVLFPDLVDADEDTSEPEPDTDVPDTTLPDTSVPDTAPPDTSACVEGAGCDDHDACTINDRCQSGVCRGDPLTCNDDLPCTADQCVGGICQHPVVTGCLIDGVCYSDNQPRPDNPCLACRSTQNTLAWSAQNGTPCDDGNACTTADTCQTGACVGGAPPAEICNNGIDDDCNGQTDGADLVCGGVTPCNYHTDCYPERVCATWVTTGQKRCSAPCSGDAECGVGKICSKVPGSVQVGFCQDAPPGNTNGQGCTVDEQCRSGLCTSGICTPTCLDEAACAFPNVTCHPVGDLAAGVLLTTSSPDPQGARGLGQMCTVDGNDFDGGLCASGHCDLMALTLQTATCNAICKSEADCAPALECNLVIAANTERFDAVPYDPGFTARTTDAVAACYTPQNPGGSLVDGNPCTTNAQCRSNKCLVLSPSSSQAWCTSFCTTDAQCLTAMACKLEVINLVSDWLVASGTARPTAQSLVRICKWR